MAAQKTAPPTKSAPKKAAPTKTQAAQSKTTHKGHPLPYSETLTAEASTHPSDPLTDQLQEEQDKLHEPGRVAKGLGDQIDNDPGYNKDQLAHMAEYWGEDERDEPGK